MKEKRELSPNLMKLFKDILVALISFLGGVFANDATAQTISTFIKSPFIS